ncbi:MAG: hypothetical protein R3B09_29000 [Nannocystaceae bacterium]
MITARISLGARRNPRIREVARLPGESNAAWIARVLPEDGDGARILLLGGASLPHFRLRTAQSHVRSDLMPSFWSHAAVLLPGEAPTIFQVGLEVGLALHEVPARNAISEVTVAHFDDAAHFPNLALLRFPGADAATVREGVGHLRLSRLSEDLVSPLVRWLGYVWGAKGATNPLLDGVALPGAALVDAAFAFASVDIVPSVSSRAACPEAIWQAALWWSGYYAGDTTDDASAVPAGAYVIGQAAASVVE